MSAFRTLAMCVFSCVLSASPCRAGIYQASDTPALRMGHGFDPTDPFEAKDECIDLSTKSPTSELAGNGGFSIAPAVDVQSRQYVRFAGQREDRATSQSWRLDASATLGLGKVSANAESMRSEAASGSRSYLSWTHVTTVSHAQEQLPGVLMPHPMLVNLPREQIRRRCGLEIVVGRKRQSSVVVKFSANSLTEEQSAEVFQAAKLNIQSTTGGGAFSTALTEFTKKVATQTTIDITVSILGATPQAPLLSIAVSPDQNIDNALARAQALLIDQLHAMSVTPPTGIETFLTRSTSSIFSGPDKAAIDHELSDQLSYLRYRDAVLTLFRLEEVIKKRQRPDPAQPISYDWLTSEDLKDMVTKRDTLQKYVFEAQRKLSRCLSQMTACEVLQPLNLYVRIPPKPKDCDSFDELGRCVSCRIDATVPAAVASNAFPYTCGAMPPGMIYGRLRGVFHENTGDGYGWVILYVYPKATKPEFRSVAPYTAARNVGDDVDHYGGEFTHVLDCDTKDRCPAEWVVHVERCIKGDKGANSVCSGHGYLEIQHDAYRRRAK